MKQCAIPFHIICARRIATGNIFISYRHEDSAGYAGRLCDHLNAEFGESRVFMDVEDIPPGQNFAQVIDRTIADCSAVLIVIGPRWMEILRTRLKENQPDYVCHEIQAALTRNTTVIPVLVGGASMAQLNDLPPGLTDLPMHQAVELRDSAFKEDCARLAKALGAHARPDVQVLGEQAPRKKISLRAGVVAGLIALFLALFIWISMGPFHKYRQRQALVQQLLNTAQTQISQAEYEAAFKTCQTLLKLEPANPAALNQQLDAAMLWVENFSVVVADGQNVEDIAGPALAEIMPVLDAGLARTDGRGSRAADILAHIGWAHWLNQHIAFKEFGPAAEHALRQALALDPSNVYGNAMLGNWLLQTNGSLEEALQHFDVAVKTGKQRPMVREMQLGGMLDDQRPEVRPELIRVADQMRTNGEPMSESYKHSILANYSFYDKRELIETLSAVPPDAAWATYLWLDAEPDSSDAEWQQIKRRFIHATLLEMEGERDEALVILRSLQKEIKARGSSGSLADRVTEAIMRLSKAPAGQG